MRRIFIFYEDFGKGPGTEIVSTSNSDIVSLLMIDDADLLMILEEQ